MAAEDSTVVTPVAVTDDAGLLALLADEREMTRLATGLQFTEGPVWLTDPGCLLFSDIPADMTLRWTPGEEGLHVERRPSHHANGLTLDHQGRLLSCEHSGRQVSRMAIRLRSDPDRDSSTHVLEGLATAWQGKRLNSPNDLVVSADGSIWFTDPNYGLPPDQEGKELDFQGVYRIAPDGTLHLLLDHLPSPNGLVFSPDESHLYVGDSGTNILRRYRVGADQTLQDETVFMDMSAQRAHGGFDGMKVDRDGRLWTTGPGGIWVAEEDGTLLGCLTVPERPANVAFGGDDFSTLFITARTSLYCVNTVVQGIGPGSPR